MIFWGLTRDFLRICFGTLSELSLGYFRIFEVWHWLPWPCYILFQIGYFWLSCMLAIVIWLLQLWKSSGKPVFMTVWKHMHHLESCHSIGIKSGLNKPCKKIAPATWKISVKESRVAPLAFALRKSIRAAGKPLENPVLHSAFILIKPVWLSALHCA